MATIRSYIDGQFGNDQQEEVGIGGFTMLARISESVTRAKNVPVTFLEDGSHVNDHQIKEPLTLSITGNVADIHRRANPKFSAITEAQAQVGNITQYAPARTQAQISRVSGLVADVNNAIDRADAIIDSGFQAANAVGLIDDTAKSLQEQFLDTMDSIYESGALIAVDMPFRTYPRMCITSLEITRDNERNALDFSIEATQFRFAETQFAGAPAPAPAPATNGQTEGETEKGAQEGEEVEQSLFSSVLGRFGVSP
jgi:hypothetical protein